MCFFDLPLLITPYLQIVWGCTRNCQQYVKYIVVVSFMLRYLGQYLKFVDLCCTVHFFLFIDSLYSTEFETTIMTKLYYIL